MSEFNNIGNMILHEFIRQVQEQGLEVSGQHPETGQISLKNADGQTVLVSLLNLVDYYYTSRDENAVNDFVRKVVSVLRPQKTPDWDKARSRVYVSLYPWDSKKRPPLAKEVADYCGRFFILDTPETALWITPAMLTEWKITEAALEAEALANGDALLAATDLEVARLDGRALGSFKLRDRTLNAALLMAPSLKDKVRERFGWPLYAVIPNKTTCRFFGPDDFSYFEQNLAEFVADEYDNPRRITPELLEFNDGGIRPICTWVKRMGYIMKFDSE
ncbi:hypothetical protein LJC71_05185 [Desulfosarcina sp. OttesenSCG-928-A07]|nr:hypothetical protein [Desulfosarcina sp. OttesenSCG-928-G17]MDL2329132.1 hypothetical protein [Desulfosarcina sp. OttesenSCG-928-A07]